MPKDAGYERVVLRSMADGEIRPVAATVVEEDDYERWYEAPLLLHNPVTRYRFMLVHQDGVFDWLNGTGVWSYDVPDVFDFTLTSYGSAPAWSRAGVIYQIFPDRFARSAAADSRPTPDWAEPTRWGQIPEPGGDPAARQLYGGDLAGIEEHLDHLESLGVSTVYLTPIFPGRSAHRYDATTFDAVDPVLGGEDALVSLTTELHARRMRVVGDLTTNHTGAGHEWFVQASTEADANGRGSSDTADFYLWRTHPGDYVSWFDVPSLPKLNWASPQLRAQFVDGPKSVVAKWLAPPYNLNGWRIDVANMTGRYMGQDLAHEVARTVRATVESVRPDGVLVAEHMHDPSEDLRGDGWQSAMNYSGFTRPVWNWLGHPENAINYLGLPTTIPHRTGVNAARTMREFAALLPWQVSSYQWNNLGSHDTARLLTLLRDERLMEVAAGLLMTYPGTPMIFAGDEWGAHGLTGEQGRVTMPWDNPKQQNHHIFHTYQALIALRNNHQALQDGGMRWLLVADDALAYLRETPEHTLLVLAARAPWRGAKLPDALAARPCKLLYGTDELIRRDTTAYLPGHGPGFSVWELT